LTRQIFPIIVTTSPKVTDSVRYLGLSSSLLDLALNDQFTAVEEYDHYDYSHDGYSLDRISAKMKSSNYLSGRLRVKRT